MKGDLQSLLIELAKFKIEDQLPTHLVDDLSDYTEAEKEEIQKQWAIITSPSDDVQMTDHEIKIEILKQF